MSENRKAQEEKIRDALKQYVSGKDFQLNPDAGVVDRVVKGLAVRQEKTGKAYCPCRMVSGDKEVDEKIVCPCAYHEEEIKDRGACHCLLFVSS